MIVRKIEKPELLESHRISSLSFHWPLDAQWKDPAEYEKAAREKPFSKGDSAVTDVWAAFTDTGEMMASMCVLPYQAAFDGQSAPMAGIGGVCTYPQHRRKGAVREMFVKAMAEMYEKKTLFSYLYPFSEQFYAKFGYHRSCASILWDFDLKAIPDSPIPGTFHLYRPGEEISGFEAAYQAFAAPMNMMVLRDPLDWSTLKQADPFKGDRSAFLYRDASGRPAGYLVFDHKVSDKGRRLLDCKEMVFDSFLTLRAILAFAKTYAADYDGIAFAAPSALDLSWFCADFPQSGTSRTIRMNGMARAVCVKEILQQKAYLGSGAFSLYVHDAFLPQNNGLYKVAFQGGAAQSVGFTPLPPAPFSKTGETADAEMTVNVFSAAILGNYRLPDFAYMEGAKIYASSEDLGRVFYKKPCWINNYF